MGRRVATGNGVYRLGLSSRFSAHVLFLSVGKLWFAGRHQGMSFTAYVDNRIVEPAHQKYAANLRDGFDLAQELTWQVDGARRTAAAICLLNNRAFF